MNKGELINAVAHCTDGFSKKDIGTILDAILDVIVRDVASGDKVVLVGFGSFEAKDRAGRRGRNPATGEDMDIPPTRVPTFHAGKEFKESVKAP